MPDPKGPSHIDGDASLALLVRVRGPDQPGVLHTLTRVIVDRRANITYIHIGDARGGRTSTYFELSGVADADGLVRDVEALAIVNLVERTPLVGTIYGKRIIVMGGGAQVGQVVVGAIAEADRHNIRGERISVDTIPLVGEADLAEAVRSVPRLPRAVALVLAGAIVGGEVARAVREIRAQCIIVVSLNMVGIETCAASPRRPASRGRGG